MIGIQGSYLCRFSIGTKQDFVSEGDLVLFTLIEDAGNILPTFQLIFGTVDEDILSYLHENNILNISIGSSADAMLDTDLMITKVESVPSGNKRTISLTGIYSAVNYMNESSIYVSSKKSALEMLIEVASKHFAVDTNIHRSKDSQVWIKPNSSDMSFINELWLHSYLPASFTSIGVSSDGKFVVRDVHRLLSSPYKWNFTAAGSMPNDIIYDGDISFTLNSGFINNWVGYGREKLLYQSEESVGLYENESLESSVMSLTNKLVKSKDVAKRYGSVGMLNENTDNNYWLAYQRNLAMLAEFSSLKVTLSFTGKYYPVRILDLCMLTEAPMNSNESTEFHSGLYIVSKVSRSIANRIHTTVVQLVREAPNKIRET